MDEYNKGQSVWKTMPGVMVSKCARAAALRLAFPSDFQGLYLGEEMGIAPDVTEVHAEVMPEEHAYVEANVPVDAPVESQELEYDPEPPTEDSRAEFNRSVEELAAVRDKDPGEVALAVLKSKKVAATGYQMGADMSAEQLDVAVSVAKGWLQQAVE